MKFRSGINELDTVLNGGFQKGTLTIILGEGEMSGKTTTLTYLANTALGSGSNVAFISLEEDTDVLKDTITNPYAKLVHLKPKTRFDTLQMTISSLGPDLIFIDGLNQLEHFEFNPEAISVLHNLRVYAMMCGKAVVAGVGVVPGHDAVQFLRMADVAMDIEEFHHKTFTLGVLKNTQGKAGLSIGFGVSH
jgi:predicted ATP-dependent serine protease